MNSLRRPHPNSGAACCCRKGLMTLPTCSAANPNWMPSDSTTMARVLSLVPRGAHPKRSKKSMIGRADAPVPIKPSKNGDSIGILVSPSISTISLTQSAGTAKVLSIAENVRNCLSVTCSARTFALVRIAVGIHVSLLGLCLCLPTACLRFGSWDVNRRFVSGLLDFDVDLTDLEVADEVAKLQCLGVHLLRCRRQLFGS